MFDTLSGLIKKRFKVLNNIEKIKTIPYGEMTGDLTNYLFGQLNKIDEKIKRKFKK